MENWRSFVKEATDNDGDGFVVPAWAKERGVTPKWADRDDNDPSVGNSLEEELEEDLEHDFDGDGDEDSDDYRGYVDAAIKKNIKKQISERKKKSRKRKKRGSSRCTRTTKKASSTRKGKKWMKCVKSDSGGYKRIHWGQAGVRVTGKSGNTKRKKRFKARHGCASAKSNTPRGQACKDWAEE